MNRREFIQTWLKENETDVRIFKKLSRVILILTAVGVFAFRFLPTPLDVIVWMLAFLIGLFEGAYHLSGVDEK